MLLAHTIVIYVVNKSGVLSRISQVFARRGFNIDSLVVSPGINQNLSRITITAKGKRENLTQIITQVSKLVDVIECAEHDDDTTVTREFALVKVRCTAKNHNQILKSIENYSGRTLEITNSFIIIQIIGNTEELNEAIDRLNHFQVLELVRTGKVAITKD